MVVLRLMVLALLLGAAASAPAQSYSIDWFTIDGGGGTSTGGPYTLSGTIGQPDAGNLSGGNFTLLGGFWSGAFAVQQLGAPTLYIRQAGPGQVTISWDPAVPGFVLQDTPTLEAPAWGNSSSGSSNPVTVSSSGATHFYRLRKP